LGDGEPYTYSTPPAILYFDLEPGIVSGQTCANCIVEVFSTDKKDGEVYEGTVTASEYGNFIFQKGAALAGPFLTATDRPPGENTSEFSQATTSRSAIMTALDRIRNRAPTYQTGFDPSDVETPLPDGSKIEDGKLIIASTGPNGPAVEQSAFLSDRFAAEFDFRVVSGTREAGHCVYQISDEYEAGDARHRALSAYFLVGGSAALSHYVDADNYLDFASAAYDFTRSNTMTLIVLRDQIAGFLNGDLLYAVLEPLGSGVYSNHSLAAEQSVLCEFDNFKFWSLEGLDLNP
jgi:hypothetical protein